MKLRHRVVGAVLVAVLSQARLSSGSNSTEGLAQLAAAILTSNNGVGGVRDIYECHPSPSGEIQVSGSVVDEQLNSLAQHYPIKWKKDHDAYVIQVGDSISSSLLDVVLPDIAVSKDNLVAATGTLFASGAVQNDLRKSGLRLLDRSIGFSPVGVQPATSGKSIILPRGTLYEDLNRLAVRAGKAVWLYQQDTCNGNKVGQFTWVRR